MTQVDLWFARRQWIKIFAFSFRPFVSAELALNFNTSIGYVT
jgi:hypothetical protein